MTDDALRIDGSRDARYTFVLAHGAGAGMDSPFLADFAAELSRCALAAGGIRVVRFEFDYMRRARERGRRGVPDPMPALLRCYARTLDALAVPPSRLVVGGKSLGGRVASHLVATIRAAGLVCLGYPFHPPSDAARLRLASLEKLALPTLICQGTRDPFGTAEEVAGYELPSCVRLAWIPDGDHDFKPRKRSGHTGVENRLRAVEAVAGFIETLDRTDNDAAARNKL